MRLLVRILLLPIRIITWVISLILNIIWSFVKAIVMLAALAALVFFVLGATTGSTEQVTTNLQNGWNNVVQTISHISQNPEISQQIAQINTDNFTATEHSRWQTNTATVYIATTNETLVAAYQDAITNWNATGAFTFTYTDDQETADIIVTEYSDQGSYAAGLAEVQTNSLTNYIHHVDVKLNTFYLFSDEYGYDYERIVHTAEHELGHAIGLDHDDEQESVMQSSGSYYGIQAVDVQEVVEIYSE